MNSMSVTTPNSEAAASPATGLDRYIAVRPGYSGGKPHIEGHRIKVQDVAIWHERLGQSAEEIAATYPGLSLAEVHAALAYYHSHRAEIDANIRADEEFVAALKSASGPSLVDEKVRQLNAQDTSLPSG
jgi:uncharacterized protein (DUF433 family)